MYLLATKITPEEGLNSIISVEAIEKFLTIFGLTITMLAIFYVVWIVLQLIAGIFIFRKAGRSGWLSIIPFVRDYVEGDICWVGIAGLIASLIPVMLTIMNLVFPHPSLALSIILAAYGVLEFILKITLSMRLARVFGRGILFGLGLLILGPIFRMILGFGRSKYIAY